MDSFVSPIISVVNVLWGPVWNQIGYVYHLKGNIETLKTAMEELSARRGDVKERVDREEAEQLVKRKQEVGIWLKQVRELEDQVSRALREDTEHEQMKCLFRWLPGSCWSTYKLGKKIQRMLNDVKKLQSKGEFNDVTFRLGLPRVHKMPTETTVGLDVMLSEVWKCLIQEKDIMIIGIYGMGGIGKTTLMKMINNKCLHEAPDFDVIIWVDVSKQVNQERIQDSIWKNLSIIDKRWEGSSQLEKATELHRVLSQKKFLLLIDDIWEGLKLSELGVPCPDHQNISKIVFTTRSEQVCNQMDAHKKFKVPPLTSDEAQELFELNVGKETLNSHPEILRYAKAATKECEGLPLALVTVGRAMAGRNNPHDWEYSVEELKINPSKISGMVARVYYLLEFSYTSLNDPALQRCFLYCCIFPEDYKIRKDDLINLWIGEGLLSETDDVLKERKRGEHFIENLKFACLLEGTRNASKEDCVKMHDVIRDMAIWIACDKEEKNDKILVEEDQEEMSKHMSSKWKKAERIFVHGSQIRRFGHAPPLNLTLKTFIVRETEMSYLPSGFFRSMKALTVLDLSRNDKLEALSEEIGELTSLQHLDLSYTPIKYLPDNLKKLTHLRCLILDGVPCRPSTLAELISSLSRLNLFSLFKNYFLETTTVESKCDLIDALGSAEELSDISIEVSTSRCALELLNHHSLRRRIRQAGISYCKGLIKIEFSLSHGPFLHLERFHIASCTDLTEIEIVPKKQKMPSHSLFSSLRHVHIYNCAALTELSWLVQVPDLETLKVSYCTAIFKIVSRKLTDEEASSLFSKLVSLDLYNLPSLTRVCDRNLSFPSLKSIIIGQCPKLMEPRLRKDPQLSLVSGNTDRGRRR